MRTTFPIKPNTHCLKLNFLLEFKVFLWCLPEENKHAERYFPKRCDHSLYPPLPLSLSLCSAPWRDSANSSAFAALWLLVWRTAHLPQQSKRCRNRRINIYLRQVTCPSHQTRFRTHVYHLNPPTCTAITSFDKITKYIYLFIYIFLAMLAAWLYGRNISWTFSRLTQNI